MNQDEHDQAAEARFLQAQAERESGKGIIEFEEMERVQARMDMVNPNDGLAIERIIGASDLLEVNFFDLGRRAARPIGRIQVRDLTGRVKEFGTGFIVSPNLILTNNHVLADFDSCRKSLIDFDFEDDEQFMPKRPTTFGLEPERFFFTDAALDFTLVAVRPLDTEGKTALSTFGRLPLIERQGKIVEGEYVTVIQHPGGATKKLAVRNNKVTGLLDHFIHYTTDTERGASGSPVFNDQWQVVSLHHAGVKRKNSQGQVMAVDNTVWEPRMGEERIAYIANEGVRVSSILAHLRAAEIKPEHKPLLDELLSEGQAAAVPAGPSAPASSVVVSPVEVSERESATLEQAEGYDPDFLGRRVELPRLSQAQLADAAQRLDGRGHILHYNHFSLVVSASRRLALYTAVNVNGRRRKQIDRDSDRWYFDPRLDRAHQAGPDLYERNDLDRGHLVRRNDPVWGSVAAEANEDTFHFTNAAPQHKKLNQETWRNLEDYILDNATIHGLKVNVFTGPVMRADDMPYRGKYQLPAEFWKVVVMVLDDGRLSATAYLQTQKNLIEDLEFAFGEYRTYQVPVTRIEAITGLDFGPLRNHDPLADAESVGGRVIGGAGDLRL